VPVGGAGSSGWGGCVDGCCNDCVRLPPLYMYSRHWADGRKLPTPACIQTAHTQRHTHTHTIAAVDQRRTVLYCSDCAVTRNHAHFKQEVTSHSEHSVAVIAVTASIFHEGHRLSCQRVTGNCGSRICSMFYLRRRIAERVCSRTLPSSAIPLLDQPFMRTDFSRRAFRFSVPSV